MLKQGNIYVLVMDRMNGYNLFYLGEKKLVRRHNIILFED